MQVFSFVGRGIVSVLSRAIEECRPAIIRNERDALADADPLTVEGSGSEERYKGMICGDHLVAQTWMVTWLYHSAAAFASEIADERLEPAPREAWPSGLNANLYTQPGDRQGWHVDTNDVSALLFVTSTWDAAAPLLVRGRDGQIVIVHAEAGDLVVLDGTRPHRVMPVSDVPRVNISMNLYRPGAYRRPETVDRLLYG